MTLMAMITSAIVFPLAFGWWGAAALLPVWAALIAEARAKWRNRCRHCGR